MPNSYSYPLDLSWTAEEMAIVIAFFVEVEKFYESKIEPEKFIRAYRAFKEVVPSKGEEKCLDKEFAKASGYSTYRAVQEVVKSKKKV